jgi:hypothetical protein
MIGLSLSVEHAGTVLSGLLGSSGANFLHNFLTLIIQAKNGKRPQV